MTRSSPTSLYASEFFGYADMLEINNFATAQVSELDRGR